MEKLESDSENLKLHNVQALTFFRPWGKNEFGKKAPPTSHNIKFPTQMVYLRLKTLNYR